MAWFSKKDKNKSGLSDDHAYDNERTNILPFEADEDDDFWDFSPLEIKAPQSNSLTANEILGKEEKSEQSEISAQESPAQRLLERMENSTEPAKSEPEIKPQVPTEKKSDLSLTAELKGIIEKISMSNKETLDAVSIGGTLPEESVDKSPADDFIISQEPQQEKEEPQKATFDTGVFKRFFYDEDGKRADQNKKPKYVLDSVETILAEAEKNADKNVDTFFASKLAETEDLPMQPANQEFHYYADEDTANFRAVDDTAPDTVYSPVEQTKTAKASQKAKKERPKFNVSIGTEAELSSAFEYNCLDDAPAIKERLKKHSGKTGLRLFLTLLVEIIAVVFLFIAQQSFITNTAINLIATALLCLINLNMLSGFAGLVNKDKQTELPLAFAMCAALIHAVCTFVLAANDAPYLSLLLGLLQIFALIGKRDKYKRIFRNFRTISNNDEKFALDIISDQTAGHAMAGDSIEGDVLLAAGRKTVNVNDFIKHSYSPQPNTKVFPICAYISLFVAACVFGATIYMTGNTINALTGFALTVLLGCPLSVTLIGNLPLWLAAKKLGYYHAMLAGHSSAAALSEVNAVAVDCHDIFPKGSVQLGGIKPLSPNKLDETILYAAVLCEAINNPLAPVFRKIANTSEQPATPPSDSIKYEYRMGISGWVNDCQLLIGNRTLMEAHSVTIPPLEADRTILKKGYFPVYVARDGVACVLLAIKYKPNSEITYELRRLCNNGVTLLVNSNDPNITSDMLCDYFGLYEECVRVMRSDGTLAYKESTNYQESTSACAAYTNSVCGLLGAVTAASKIKSLTTTMLVIHIIFAVLGIALSAVLTVMGSISITTTVYALLLQMLGMLCTCLPPYASRP